MHTVVRHLLAASLFWLMGVGSAPRAQAAAEFTAQALEYRFGEQLHFTAEFASPAIILEGYVFYQSGPQGRVWVYEGEINDQRLVVDVPLEPGNQPQAFSDLRYWFRIASDHGEFFESPIYTHYYDDNRFEWQRAELAPFELYWHSGQAQDAAAALQAAHAGLQRVQALLPLPAPPSLTLRVYQQATDAERAAQSAGYPWSNGHMPPGQGPMLFAGGAEAAVFEQQVAHEVAHHVLYAGLGAEGYANLPAWLNEGIASLAEGQPDPQRAALLQAATLLPVYTLCQTMPTDPAQAHIAYAQSAALTRYLLERFNNTGFGILVEAYARSGDCIQAPQAAFGVDLLQLELDWRRATFETPGLLSQVQWRPLGLAALVALVLWGLARLSTRAGRQ